MTPKEVANSALNIAWEDTESQARQVAAHAASVISRLENDLKVAREGHWQNFNLHPVEGKLVEIVFSDATAALIVWRPHYITGWSAEALYWRVFTFKGEEEFSFKKGKRNEKR